MLRKSLLIVTVVALLALAASGCKKQSEPAPSPPAEPAQPTAAQPKTLRQYRAEAEKQIKPENLEDELARLEKEINQDVAAEQP